jgi:hypothetical protein
MKGMAGSYKHCTNEKGEWIGDHFTESIENLGDAHEACEEMFYMIQFLSHENKSLIEQAVKEAQTMCFKP